MEPNAKPDLSQYLTPTAILDSDHPAVIAYAQEKTAGMKDPVRQAIALFDGVRDDIWYDPYSPFYKPDHYRASIILEKKAGFCINKAGLLCALGRTCGIPSRIGFATVQNHLATRQLLEHMGSNLFVFHGYTEFFLNGKWVKATPTFNSDLCVRHGVPPLVFNGYDDAIFHEYNSNKQKFMEYKAYHGTFADIPVETIVMEWEKAYGQERVRKWMELIETSDCRSARNFAEEDVVKT